MFDLSHSLFILMLLLQLMLSVAVGVSVGRGMGIKDSHIKEGAVRSNRPPQKPFATISSLAPS